MSAQAYLSHGEKLYIHGMHTSVQARVPKTAKNSQVVVNGPYGEYVKLTGNTVHDVVKAVMKASCNKTKKSMIEHLQMLIEEDN
jgi:hypothetical protein